MTGVGMAIYSVTLFSLLGENKNVDVLSPAPHAAARKELVQTRADTCERSRR